MTLELADVGIMRRRPVERGSDKHSPRLDEALRHETEGMVRSGRDTHAEEWKSAEPSGEDEPDVDRVPDGTRSGGTPNGMTSDDVAGRSELASYLGKDVYPAVREQLIGLALDNNAPTAIVDQLRELPSGRTFSNVSEVWEALGGSIESERF